MDFREVSAASLFLNAHKFYRVGRNEAVFGKRIAEVHIKDGDVQNVLRAFLREPLEPYHIIFVSEFDILACGYAGNLFWGTAVAGNSHKLALPYPVPEVDVVVSSCRCADAVCAHKASRVSSVDRACVLLHPETEFFKLTFLLVMNFAVGIRGDVEYHISC